jgi:transcriptional regulator with XRE-family HTH domain
VPRLSQGALADAAGLSRSTVAAVELGRYPSLDWSTVERLAAGLGVEPTVLSQAHPERGSLSPAVADFMQSDWRAAMAPTDAELLWLQSLSPVTWSGLAPTAETVAMLLRWRREQSRS